MPHVRRLGTAFSNSWLLEIPGTGKRVLIDTGHGLERLGLLGSLWASGVRMRGDLHGVLLTHRHSDHAGNAGWLRKHFGAPVFCHEREAPFLEGKRSSAALQRDGTPLVKHLLCGIEDRHPAQTEVDDHFEEGLWKWGLRIQTVPGHTAGSVMIHHEATATLFSGDTILVGNPGLRSSKKLRVADPDYSEEPAIIARNLRRYLQELPPTEILCSGHGPIVEEQAFQKLKKLMGTIDAQGLIGIHD